MTTTTLSLTTITFPEIRLPQRAAAQLRGYFGNYFKEHSPLLHNHYEGGKTRYGYPLVQYKVLGGTPTLVGVKDGAQLLAELFFQMKSIQIDGREYTVMERDIEFKQLPIGVGDSLYNYRFVTPWMALNQDNYPTYLQKEEGERSAMLSSILTANILSFFKGLQLYLPKEVRVMSTVRPRAERLAGFKDNLMTTIVADFTTNALLPDLVGLGKSTARGFGTIVSQ
jgi:hypothetical protein